MTYRTCDSFRIGSARCALVPKRLAEAETTRFGIGACESKSTTVTLTRWELPLPKTETPIVACARPKGSWPRASAGMTATASTATTVAPTRRTDDC